MWPVRQQEDSIMNGEKITFFLSEAQDPAAAKFETTSKTSEQPAFQRGHASSQFAECLHAHSERSRAATIIGAKGTPCVLDDRHTQLMELETICACIDRYLAEKVGTKYIPIHGRV